MILSRWDTIVSLEMKVVYYDLDDFRTPLSKFGFPQKYIVRYKVDPGS